MTKKPKEIFYLENLIEYVEKMDINKLYKEKILKTIHLEKQIMMEWEQIVSLILGDVVIVIPLFILNRSEENSDRRDMIDFISAIKDEVNTPSDKAEGLSRLRGLRSWPYPLYGEGI